MTTAAKILRSGIHALDALFHSPLPGSEPPLHALTTCIIGPDGTGKSLLALHYASTYLRDCHRSRGASRPLVIYASTDFSYQQAHSAWENFGLDLPSKRENALRSAYHDFQKWDGTFSGKQIPFKHVVPVEDSELQKKGGDAKQPLRNGDNAGQHTRIALSTVLQHPDTYRGQFLFLDLQRESAGDDWTSLNHVLGLLGSIGRESAPPLLIIDAIEGLETYVGSRDAHGERRPRRSRVAQLARTCGQANSHLVVVIEEAIQNRRLPEQFVSDVVIRLKKEPRGSETVRTVEIEKCRSCGHISGPNDYYIRRGTGTSTGRFENWDHPTIKWGSSNLSHFHLVPSIECVDASLRASRLPLPQQVGQPSFGLGELDSQFPEPLFPNPSIDNEQPAAHLGSTSILMGDSGTLKSRLGVSFLSQVFKKDKENKNDGIAILVTGSTLDASQLKAEIVNNCSEAASAENGRIIVRRLTSRFISAAQLLQIIMAQVHAAQRILIGMSSAETENVSKLTRIAKGAHRIRLVIDDWSLILASHPSIQHNTLFLPTLLSLLQREGVASLIIATDSVRGPSQHQANTPNDLRKLDIPQIHTWSVPFFGERRVAISTVVPRYTDKHPEVYELRYDSDSVRKVRTLQVDRHFALYTGLETSNPKRVPLVIRLYGGPHTGHGSTEKRDQAAFPRALSQMLGQLFPARPEHDVVKFEPFSTYDDFFAFANWLDEARLDHTVVFQIDEFWTSSKGSSLAPLNEYWNEYKVDKPDGERNEGEDVYDVFQRHDIDDNGPPRIEEQTKEGNRKKSKNKIPVISKSYQGIPNGDLTRSDTFFSNSFGAPTGDVIDRVPFLWDFGMILARKDLWQRAVESLTGDDRDIVDGVWNSLCREGDTIGIGKPRAMHGKIGESLGPRVSWWLFFKACRLVASCTPDANVVPFDVDNNTAESLSSLLLEIWASYAQKPFSVLSRRVGGKSSSLRHLLTGGKEHPNDLALFCACEQLLSVTGHLRGRRSNMERSKCKTDFVASREWYSTSSAIMSESDVHHYSLLSLPGSFSTRGDWFLAVAKGSRSRLLGQRAIDLLSSRRLGLLRTQDGLGLPVRDILPDGQIDRMKSAITHLNPTTGQMNYLEYGEVAGLRNPRLGLPLNWLWRSRMEHYDRDSFFWRRWIARLYEDQQSWRPHNYMDTEKQLERVSSLLRIKELHRPESSEADAVNVKFTNFQERIEILKSAIWP